MDLYRIAKNLKYIGEKPFRLEKEIQSMTEANLNTIFRLQLVKSEFALKNFRIDTLAYDGESNAFVIIEYKRGKNFSVIDQGFSYLSLMLDNKAEFILEFNESQHRTLTRADVDWSQSRVLFLSQKFTTYQLEAINFKDLPIELWEVKRFENNTVSFDQIQKSSAQKSISTIAKTNRTINKISKEIKVYSESEHLEIATDEIKELYEKVRASILDLSDLEVKPKKRYIAFVAGRNAVDIKIQKKALKLFLNLKLGELEDPKDLMRDVSDIGHHGNGDYEVQFSDDENLEYIMSLVKQSIKKNRK